MSTEWILRELYALWDKLKIVFSRLLDAPEILRAWSEGRASMGDRVSLVVALVLIVAAIMWIVRFFKAGFWKKLGMLLSAALVIFAAALVLSFFSKTDPAETAPEDPVLSAEPAVSATAELPAAQTEEPAVTPAATPIPRSNGQYSLARGAEDRVYGRVDEMWRIVDDAVSWQLSDALVLQLSRLQSLPGTGRYINFN